jgi:hypothetical protein
MAIWQTQPLSRLDSVRIPARIIVVIVIVITGRQLRGNQVHAPNLVVNLAELPDQRRQRGRRHIGPVELRGDLAPQKGQRVPLRLANDACQA